MRTITKLTTLYRTEIGLLWHWRLGRAALVKRALIATLVALIAFNLTAWLLPGLVSIDEFGGGLLAVIFIRAACVPAPHRRGDVISQPKEGNGDA